jgi:glycosyltransferase involved in cell wall biosynthesis
MNSKAGRIFGRAPSERTVTICPSGRAGNETENRFRSIAGHCSREIVIKNGGRETKVSALGGITMRIGVDAQLIGKDQGGIERYVRHLVEHVPDAAEDDQFIIFVSRQFTPTKRRNNVCYVPLPFGEPILPILSTLPTLPTLHRSVLLPWLARQYRLDVLHVVQRMAPPIPGCRIVLSMHKTLPASPNTGNSHALDLLARLLTWRAIRRVDRILAPSQTVRAELVEALGVPAEKVVAVHNGIDSRRFSIQKDSENTRAVIKKTPYVLCAGALEPNKNLEMTLEAFKAFASKRGERVKLIIVGGERAFGYRRKLELLVEELDLEREVEITGFVSDKEYLELLRGARLLLAPSRDRGFDLPPIEAMACGTPVVCSDIEIHRELLHDRAAFFAVDKPSQLAAQLDALWDDVPARARLRRCGLERAATLTWESTAWQIAETYKAVGKSKHA